MYRRAADRLPKRMARHGGLLRTVAVCVILAALICLGFHLRYQYAVSSSPFWDEFFTLWSARSIAERPISALQWGPGADAPLFRDLEALVLRTFGFNAIVARVPSIIISVATIPVLFYVGKRMFSIPAGLLACALLAFAPELVTEGARARPYALLVLLTLLCVLLFYRWLVEPGDGGQRARRWGWAFAACFAAAVFTHLEAILLLPGFALGALVRRGPTIFARKGVLLSFLACGAATIVALALFLQGETIPGAIPVGQTLWAGSGQISLGVKNLEVFAKFFRGAPGGFASLFIALGGAAYLIVEEVRKRFYAVESSSGHLGRAVDGAGTEAVRQNDGLVLLYVLLSWVAGAIVLLLGPRWGSETRYLLFVFPALSLVVGGVGARAVEFVVERAGVSGATAQQYVTLSVVSLAIVLIGALSLPGWGTMGREWGYDLAFGYVADHWQEGDVTVTVAPVACLVSLGRCDYIAFQKAYETYAVESDGRLVEALTRLPLVMTVNDMEQVLDRYARVWFVSDEGRLLSRYDTDFVQLVWNRMELVANERGALVFRSIETEPPSVQREVDVRFEDKFSLRGCDLNRDTIKPGEGLQLTLYWQGIDFASYFGKDYSVFVHLVDRTGRPWAQADGYPVAGLYPTSRWRSTLIVIPDRRRMLLPQDMPAGRYRLEAGVYLLSTGQRLHLWDPSGAPLSDTVILDYLQVGQGLGDQPEPMNPLQANLGDQVEILGFDLAPGAIVRGDSMSISLYWRALAEMERDYTVFVHLVGRDGRIVSQHDGQPQAGFYPTSFWDQGEAVRDEHALLLPSGIEDGEYELRVGMYLLEDMRRLPVLGVTAVEDWVTLARVEVAGNSADVDACRAIPCHASVPLPK